MKTILVAVRLTEKHREYVRTKLDGLGNVLFFDEMDERALEAIADRIHIVLRYGGYKPFSDKVFSRMTRLERVQLLCAGTDTIRRTPTIPETVQACGAIGANSVAVAEHAFALMLSAAKRVVERNALMRQGVFDQREPTKCLEESALVVVGLGSIGTEIARRAKAFGMTIYGINRRKHSDIPIDFVGDLGDLDHVLGESDFVILVLPLTDETRHIVTKRELDLMKPDACLINVGRGPLVNEADLFEHLEAHPRFIAGLDVWWAYPQLNEEIWFFKSHPYNKPFHTLENVILSPHCAALSGDYRMRMLRTALDGIVRHLRNKDSKEVV